MRKLQVYAGALLAGLWSISCQAQEDARPLGYSYTTYYVCDVASQANMDNVIEINEKSIFDQWVADDKMLAWGYLSHFTGGRWRRLQYHVAPTIAAVLRNQAEIFGEIYADNAVGGQARADACEAHDDYVWAIEQGSTPGAADGDVSLAIYFVCDLNRESRADAIVRLAQAPMLRKMVEDGTISGWSWQTHRLGGRYRRLAVLTGNDYASVVAARATLLQEMSEKNSELANEFNAICDEHTDYLWDVVH